MSEKKRFGDEAILENYSNGQPLTGMQKKMTEMMKEEVEINFHHKNQGIVTKKAAPEGSFFFDMEIG